MIHLNGYAWRNVPNEYKDLYFEEFKRDELQKEPNLSECFEQMHKKKDGILVDERSKRIAEEIQARHDAAICGSSATSQLHQDAMKEMVNQQLETMRAEMDAKIQDERAEMEAKLQAQMQAQIASLMDELRRNGIISTSMAQPQNTQLEHSINSNDENLRED
nr:uncharacterized protein LOC109157302 isoform X1 [Ipomoea batatas]